MTDTWTQCPKCGYTPALPLSDRERCPVCGVYGFKLNAASAVSDSGVARWHEEKSADTQTGLIASLLRPMEMSETHSLYGYTAMWLGLVVWSWFLFGYDYRDGEINGSFMHAILLPIHEAGHVLFSPLGEFMMFLGGSLFQLALPCAIGIAFIVKNRDNFGAAIAMWWTSVSLVDLSPYIYDALHPQLTLVGGGTGENRPHDWIYLLSTVGQLNNAQFWGHVAHMFGGLAMLVSLVWASLVLWRSREYINEDLQGF